MSGGETAVVGWAAGRPGWATHVGNIFSHPCFLDEISPPSIVWKKVQPGSSQVLDIIVKPDRI